MDPTGEHATEHVRHAQARRRHLHEAHQHQHRHSDHEDANRIGPPVAAEEDEHRRGRQQRGEDQSRHTADTTHDHQRQDGHRRDATQQGNDAQRDLIEPNRLRQHLGDERGRDGDMAPQELARDLAIGELEHGPYGVNLIAESHLASEPADPQPGSKERDDRQCRDPGGTRPVRFPCRSLGIGQRRVRHPWQNMAFARVSAIPVRPPRDQLVPSALDAVAV